LPFRIIYLPQSIALAGIFTEGNYLRIEQIKAQLYLVNLDIQELPGFRDFISCWIYKGKKETFVVDPGPAGTIHILREALERLEIDRLDYILLTHIHIDHAGGTGLLCADYPEARVICHAKATPHLIDPTKLWEGSVNVLGESVCNAYQPIAPVTQNVLHTTSEIPLRAGNINIFPTPGHAAHHQSFLLNGDLFAGEALGTFVPGTRNPYLRLATPHKFIDSIFRKSVQACAATGAENVFFAHNHTCKDARATAAKTIQQLDLWLEQIDRLRREANITEANMFAEIQKKDALLSDFYTLPEDIQQRELYFIKNSFKGIRMYLDTQSAIT
jgi:glyoxylase-like metal-dependent hydrolase (beta-lactamase superfamily II)